MDDLAKIGSINSLLYKISDKNIFSLIEDSLLRFYNENTKDSYRKALTDYFCFLHIELASDFFQVLLRQYPELVNLTSQFLSQCGLKPSTIKHRTACLNSFYHWLHKAYLVNRNPVIKPEIPKEARKSKTKSLPTEELKKKLRYLQDYSQLDYLDHLTYVLALTLAMTSLRISEALQITIDMVTEGKLEIVQKRGQTRQVPLPPEVQRELLEFARKYELQQWVFQTEGKRKPRKQLTRGHAYDLLKRGTGLSCHGFRKSAIEILLQLEVPITEVKKVSGHESIEMVDYYDTRDSTPSEHARLVEALLDSGTCQKLGRNGGNQSQ